MNHWKAYKESKKIYNTQKALAPFKGVEPNAMPSQLRMDVTPAGVCVGTIAENTFNFVASHPCENYAAAIAIATQEIHTNPLLKPASSVVFTLWPEDIQHDSIPIGSSQKYTSIKAVDQKLLTNPGEFSLDSAFAYRTINLSSWNEAHYVGLKAKGWQAMGDVLPMGTCLGRYWGPLTTLDILLDHFRDIFASEATVLGLVEPFHVIYFKLEKGDLDEIKISPRSSLKKTDDLKKILKEFSMSKKSQVYMIDLTSNPKDTDALCLNASQEEGIQMNMVDRSDLLKTFQMLAPAANFPFFPIALIQGGKDANA